MGSRGPLAWQAPLHRLRAAGVGAAGDDAEIGARLFERLRIDMGLGGRLLDGASRCDSLPYRYTDSYTVAHAMKSGLKRWG